MENSLQIKHCLQHIHHISRQYQFSPNKGGYIPAPPYPGYPGGVNGLAMHTDTMAFAEPPQGAMQSVKPAKNSLGHFADEEDRCSIDEAPIYSPSMGNLSQYSNTPVSKTRAPTVRTTPSKEPALKKSKSGFSLFSRGAFGRNKENKPLKTSMLGSNQVKPKCI